MIRILSYAILAASLAQSQSATDRPEFDAVAIRLSAPDARGGGFNVSPGRLNAKNRSLKDLVRFAYDLQDYQVSGGLAWTDNERYEIVATFPGETTKSRCAQMMQTMLAYRFALAMHRESKDISGFALVVGKNGARLHPAESGEHGMMLGRSATSGLRTLTANNAKIADLAALLADLLGRPVEDKTSLDGVFDSTMEWAPDSTSEGSRRPGSEKLEAPADGPAGPSIFTALQESLGLKLENLKMPVETIVIDRAEKPSAN